MIEGMHEQPCALETPRASTSFFEAGRCQRTAFSPSTPVSKETNRARVVDNSTSRVRNHEPATMAEADPTGPFGSHGSSSSILIKFTQAQQRQCQRPDGATDAALAGPRHIKVDAEKGRIQVATLPFAPNLVAVQVLVRGGVPPPTSRPSQGKEAFHA